MGEVLAVLAVLQCAVAALHVDLQAQPARRSKALNKTKSSIPTYHHSSFHPLPHCPATPLLLSNTALHSPAPLQAYIHIIHAAPHCTPKHIMSTAPSVRPALPPRRCRVASPCSFTSQSPLTATPSSLSKKLSYESLP
jgi:hypothetical protein